MSPSKLVGVATVALLIVHPAAMINADDRVDRPDDAALAGVVGMLAGMAAVLLGWQTLKVEFLWFNVIGCFVVLLVGWLVSRVERQRA